MRKFVYCLLVCMLALPVFAGPRIDFDERSFDFGYIPEGTKVTHRYIIRNVGDSDLTIKSIRPTCGCTVAPISKDVIEPGGTAVLSATFNSSRFRNYVVKYIRINSDDPDVPAEKVAFSANVSTADWPLVASPEEVSFGGGVVRSVTVRIRNGSTQRHNMMVVENPDSGVSVDLRTGSAGPGGDFVVVFRLDEGVPVTHLITSATFEIDDEARTRISIPITGTDPVAPADTTTPDNPFLGG